MFTLPEGRMSFSWDNREFTDCTLQGTVLEGCACKGEVARCWSLSSVVERLVVGGWNSNLHQNEAMETLSLFFLFSTGLIPLHSVALSLLHWVIMTLRDCKVTKGEKSQNSYSGIYWGVCMCIYTHIYKIYILITYILHIYIYNPQSCIYCLLVCGQLPFSSKDKELMSLQTCNRKLLNGRMNSPGRE